MRSKLVLATLVAALSLVGLSACADNEAPKTPFNSVDASFAQDMIPHHRQATEMARLAPDRSQNDQVLDLASQITAVQKPEIDTMTGWLRSWDKEVPSTDMNAMSGMSGMMSDEQMSSLTASTGKQFDTMFLTMMTVHHQGAIEMAAKEEADGKNTHAVELAKKIQTDQAAEIKIMRSLLDS